MFGTATKITIKAAMLLAVVSGLATPAFAAKPPSARQLAQLCGQAPIVRVVENIHQPVVTTRKPASYSKKIKAGWRIQGLAELKRSFKANFQWEILNTAAGSCLRIKSVQVQTGVIQPQIWINPRIRRNSCEYKVTLNHELQHVQNHNAYIRQFSNDVRRNLASRLRNKSGIVIKAGTDTRAAKDMLMQRTMDILYASNRSFDAIADSKDRAMDTETNYRREYNICR